MAVSASDVTYKKSVVVTDTATNGGRKGDVTVVSGVRHSLFPRVTKTERINGVTRYRKEFWYNANADDDIAYGVLQWFEIPSNAGDRFYFLKGTQTDTQANLTSPSAGEVPLWVGCGVLNTALSGGETSVLLDMENDDFVFENGGYLHISDKTKTGQTIASDVNPGDSVNFSGAIWNKISTTENIDYPNGLYLGNNSVLTVESTTHEEWLIIAENVTTDEDIGTGDGIDTAPTLTTLTNNTNGICQVSGKTPVITTLNTSDVTMTVTLNPDGTIASGSDATAGELNMATGAWTTDITWTSAPKNAQDILITYRENSFSYTGNTVTIQLDDTVANTYTVASTTGSNCVYDAEVKATTENFTITSTAGTFDDTTYPIIPHNDGAEEDLITITFTSPSIFSVSGANLGSLGTGYTLSADCVPTHPTTGKDIFTLNHNGWGGTWAAAETIEFDLHPSAVPIWLKEEVPSGTSAEPYNIVVIGWYAE